ncbi:MAG TPA: GGDEF domain-containing protein [Moraxellaceae bacterium]|nr:GGDEF domain-containing protein [Moraxellaceae bacterium]
MRMLRELFNHTTPSGRGLIGIAASLPFFLWQGISYVNALGDPAVNAAVLRGIIGLFIAGTLVEIVTGLWLWPRRHSPAPVFGASMVLALTITLVFTAVMIAFGSFTSGANLIPVGLLAIGLHLFERRVVVFTFVVCILVLLAADILVMAGRYPYAPALTAHAFIGDHPADWWNYWRTWLFYIGTVMLASIPLGLYKQLDLQRQRLEEMSRTDGLTALANRRHFMERLETEILRARRYRRPFCVVIADADHFKAVNDLRGHHTGDEVLRQIGRILGGGVRIPNDVAARLGGEEFALLLPETTGEQARGVCERIARQLRDYEFGQYGDRFRVTISMGVVQGLTADAEALLREADRNLYQAKAGGRDRVVSSVGA